LEQTSATPASADLGQKEAKSEALSDEQLRHMEGGPAAKSAQQKKRESGLDKARPARGERATLDPRLFHVTPARVSAGRH
jgi:hypothetical protein